MIGKLFFYLNPKHIINFLNRQRKLKSDILVESLAILSTSIVLIIAYTYFSNTQSFFIQSQHHLKSAASMLKDKINRTIQGTESVVNAYVPLLGDDELKETLKRLDLINSFSAVLASNPQLSTIYFGTPEGYYLEFSTPRSLKAYMARIGIKIPENTTTIIKKVIHEDIKNPIISAQKSEIFKQTNEYWYYVIDSKYMSEPNIGEKTGYDPRKRGWYITASKSQDLVWSDVYLFAATVRGETGITASRSIYDNEGKFKGVFAADISLFSFSTFLAESKVTPNSRSYIVDGLDKVVASSHLKTNAILKDDTFTLMTIDDSKDPILQTTMKHYKMGNNKEEFIYFNLAGEDYIAAFEDFPKNFPNDWKVVIISPIDDFIEPIKHNRNQVLLYSIVILLVAFFLAYRLARRISNPIILLAEEAQKIQDLDLSGKLVINSKIKEIMDLAQTMASLKNSMQSFSYYIPKSLVKQLITRKQSIHIGGRLKEVSMMFTDIESFTTVSEQIPADRLVEYLSEYFEEMTSIIIKYHGTIDKYIGDAIMCFWGAPVPDRHHIFNACRSALLCQQRLKELNRQWKREGRPVFNTRMGLHMGEVVIGNMGSTERMNYTAIGDSVNLCARLEGINKIYGTNIIVSETIFDLVRDHFLFRRLDTVAVKGKEKAIRIYELIAQMKGDNALYPSDEQTEYTLHFEKALKLYTTRQWQEALEAFEVLIPPSRSDLSAKLYIQRCQEFLKNPPPKDWNGSIIMHEK